VLQVIYFARNRIGMGRHRIPRALDRVLALLVPIHILLGVVDFSLILLYK
jgi:hypothetical protein